VQVIQLTTIQEHEVRPRSKKLNRQASDNRNNHSENDDTVTVCEKGCLLITVVPAQYR